LINIIASEIICQNLAHSQKLSPTRSVFNIINCQIQQFQRPLKSQPAVLATSDTPVNRPPHLTANIGHLLKKRQPEPSPLRQFLMLISHFLTYIIKRCLCYFIILYFPLLANKNKKNSPGHESCAPAGNPNILRHNVRPEEL